MTKEELDAALATTPSLQPPKRTFIEPTPLEAEPDPEAERLAREANRERQIASVRAQQDKLEGRLGGRLKEAIRGARTPCALFLGPTGCGKTSGALYLTALASNRATLVRARDLANAERRHPLGQGTPPTVQNALDATYLIIDDVGSEGSDPGTIQDVLDVRYSSGRAVIVTTGLTMSDLTAHIGAAYVRRIVDQHVRRRDGTEFPVMVVDCHE